MLGLLLALIGSDCVASQAPDTLAKADIPADLPPDIRGPVEQIFSGDPVNRRGAFAALLRNDAESSDLRTAAASQLTVIGDPQIAALLTDVAKASGDPELCFWAAIGAVEFTHGAIDDARALAAIEERCATTLDQGDIAGTYYADTAQKAPGSRSVRVRMGVPARFSIPGVCDVPGNG